MSGTSNWSYYRNSEALLSACKTEGDSREGQLKP